MYLKATVDFKKDEMPSYKGNFLLPDQMYSISLDMTIPTDQTNQNVGLFMVCLSLESSSHSQMKPKICKSAILPFRTSIYRIMWSLIPFQVTNMKNHKLLTNIDKIFDKNANVYILF